MTRCSHRLLVIVAALAAAIALAAAPAFAQEETGKPIRLKAPKVKLAKFKGQVLHANRVQITVRSAENELLVRTFTYSAEVSAQMEKVLDRGGYQHGDKVEIQHAPGADVAVKLKGKPSKPL